MLRIFSLLIYAYSQSGRSMDGRVAVSSNDLGLGYLNLYNSALLFYPPCKWFIHLIISYLTVNIGFLKHTNSYSCWSRSAFRLYVRKWRERGSYFGRQGIVGKISQKWNGDDTDSIWQVGVPVSEGKEGRERGGWERKGWAYLMTWSDHRQVQAYLVNPHISNVCDFSLDTPPRCLSVIELFHSDTPQTTGRIFSHLNDVYCSFPAISIQNKKILD